MLPSDEVMPLKYDCATWYILQPMNGDPFTPLPPHTPQFGVGTALIEIINATQ